METIDGDNLKQKIFVGISLIAAIGLVAFSSLDFLNLSMSDWTVFFTTIAVNFILVRYNTRLSHSSLYYTIKEPVILWSAVWLGIGGATAIAFMSGLLNIRAYSRSRLKWFTEISLVTISTFLAGNVFYKVLSIGFSKSINPVHTHFVDALPFVTALLVTAIIYEIIYCVGFFISLKLQTGSAILPILRSNQIFLLIMPIGVVALVFAFQHLVWYFGITFGSFVFPLVLLTHFAYRAHRKQLALKTKEIRETTRIHQATVEALATAIDARDQVGRGHVSRTQIYAVGLGRILGLSIPEIKALSTGALLHDIGKLAVPDHILNKPGRLTPAELEKMKIHPVVGASILEHVEFPYPVVTTVRHHHENWNGTGYPDRLSGEKIPLTARILSIADAYDTLRGARPYRPSVSKEEARRFIMGLSGSQFDPQLVDLFLRNLSSFEQSVQNKGLTYSLDAVSNEAFSADGKSTLSYVEQIKRANREVYTLYELARVFSASGSLRETLALFVEKIGELVPFDTCAIFLLDESQKYAEARHVVGKNAEQILNRKVAIGSGATGYTLKKRQPVYHISPALDLGSFNLESDTSYVSMASLPLITNERLIGAVSIYSCKLDAYEDEHMRLLETLSRIAADAISSSLRHAETETRAYTDAMTNLPNARSLQIHFEKEVSRAKRDNTRFQLLMLDLDGFKAVNDTHGHKAGDRLLNEVARVMRSQLREYDFLARYAGDEFVAIIPNATPEAVSELCARMEKAVQNYKLNVGDGVFASVGVSLGSSTYPMSGDSLDKLIVAADKAMYAVKGMRKAKQQKSISDTNQLNDLLQADFERSRSQPPLRAQIVEEKKIHDDIDSVIVELDETHVVRQNPNENPNAKRN
ncbi:MAG: diguanylate cyclase [Pyrinomonadaceae bacterium]